MLLRLRGQTHQVYTALAVLHGTERALMLDWCVTQVPMRTYSDAEVSAYIATGDPLDKAGAYAIQHAGFHPVEQLDSCYANVVGLPLCHLTRTLVKLGVAPINDVPRVCQQELDYCCPVFRQVLDFTI
jgi:predicted house-cleaning NTP pyrophosphatase (Maf/HAM1 superfamily)